MAEVVRIMEDALDAGGGEHARVALQNALFAAKVERAVDAAREGKRRRAEREMSDLRESAQPDQLALLGGGYLTLHHSQRALEVYDRSLTYDPRHVPSLIGKASAIESIGGLDEAGQFLGRTYDANPDPRIGLALAQVQGRLGQWGSGLATLERVRATDPAAEGHADSPWGDVEPLPALALPSGEVPEDRPPSLVDGVSSRVSSSDVERLERELSSKHYPYTDIGGGYLGRSGNPGTSWMNAGVAGAAVAEFQAGPLRLQADVLSVLVNNGETQQMGASASLGTTASKKKVGYDARVGISPIGFAVSPYVTWLGGVTLRASPSLRLGLDTGRAPITDSLLSWAGAVDATSGHPFGQASYTWGGGWLTFANPSLTDGGVRVRVGSVEAIAMDPVDRHELSGWAGQTLGSESLAFRIGASFTWLSHARPVFGFELGETGIFSPDSFTLGMAQLGMDYDPGTGFRACASAAVGAQYATGDPVPAFFAPGFDEAFEFGAGVRFPLSGTWELGVDARTQRSGEYYNQTSAVLRVAHVPRWAGTTGLRRVSPIHGSGVSNMTVCRD